MRATLEQKLRRCPLFDGVEDLALLARCLCPVVQRLDRGGGIRWPGKGYAAVVAAGAVESAGECYHAGEVLGLEAALLQKRPPAAAARRRSSVVLLPVEGIRRPCAQGCPDHRRLADNAVVALAARAAALKERQDLLLIRGVRARLCRYLSLARRRAGRDLVALPLNRRELAEYLHLSRPSLSRELCALRDEGILEFYRESVKFLRPEKLEEQATGG